jgi:hypothetical protein
MFLLRSFGSSAEMNAWMKVAEAMVDSWMSISK